MNRSEIISYRLNRLMANRNPKALVSFIESLIDNQEDVLQTIIDEIKVDTARRLEQINDQKDKLEAASTQMSKLSAAAVVSNIE